MYTKRSAFVGALAMVAMVGCETATGPENDAVQLTSGALSVATSEADVLDLGDGFAVVGSSKVTRNSNGATGTLHTSALTPGNAYTMWMVMFNAPGACDPCGESDIAPGTAAEVDAIYLTGHVVGGNGRATFSGHLSKDDTSGSLFGAGAVGLTNPLGAEIWLIVVDHGPALPGEIPGQIQGLGTCGDTAFGCADALVSIHKP